MRTILNEQSRFSYGDRVRKTRGYRYPGIIVAVFSNREGQTRYVVECTVAEVAGMLHIYSDKDLEPDEN